MKKFLAVLMALTVCATATYSVCATDDSSESDPIVSADENTSSGSNESNKDYSDIIANIDFNKYRGDADAIMAALEEFKKSGQTKDDVNALIFAVSTYLRKYGMEISDLQRDSARAELIYKFLEDAGINTDALKKALDESPIINDISSAVSGSKPNGSSGSGSGSSGDSYNTYNINESIPDTGYVG